MTPLIHAAERGYESMAKLLVKSGAEMESKDAIGKTPFIHAAERGAGSVVKLLINNGADVTSKDKSGETPLDWL
jgi:ankyrin repeat protein